ncbi:MAG: 4Fe-4S binding protein [Dysgonamonadaceae bacterium]|jgi:polyferredoxin|nr:4Fe-4S binding protein [Dysgonamonadaceae bacterium]
MNLNFNKFLPFLIGVSIGLILYFSVHWWGFFVVFPWIGLSISIGLIVASAKKGKQKDIGRKLSILLISPVFLVFLGTFQRENLQVEETVFYMSLFLATGLFTRVLIHFAVAKIFGPLIWGRGFCGWACWTAAVLDWLPINENKPLPKKYEWYRYPVLVLSLLIPLAFIVLGYDYVNGHLQGKGSGLFQTAKFDQLIWFLIGNALYYISGIILAFKFRKKRAFCKILCPVSLLMKPQSTVALIRRRPTENHCIECGSCNRNCPMDVDVMSYISRGRNITSSECIQCCICINVCGENAIK